LTHYKAEYGEKEFVRMRTGRDTQEKEEIKTEGNRNKQKI
jgi:hypothetical protein